MSSFGTNNGLKSSRRNLQITIREKFARPIFAGLIRLEGGILPKKFLKMSKSFRRKFWGFFFDVEKAPKNWNLWKWKYIAKIPKKWISPGFFIPYEYFTAEKNLSHLPNDEFITIPFWSTAVWSEKQWRVTFYGYSALELFLKKNRSKKGGWTETRESEFGWEGLIILLNEPKNELQKHHSHLAANTSTCIGTPICSNSWPLL